jgi:type III pantothenate kinase
MPAAPLLIAVDVGNSRIKLGQFTRQPTESAAGLPEPDHTFDVPLSDSAGHFDAERLSDWCVEHAEANAQFLVGSVHRGAASRFAEIVSQVAAKASANWPVRNISFADVPMKIRVDQPARVGIDRLLAAVAANRLRRPERGAIVIDLGSAVTVDCVDLTGAFAGGAILPGIAMSARALAEQTDALPRVEADWLDHPPPPLGKSTVAAIESGLYWGAIGAIRELINQFSAAASVRPDVFLTGGASSHFAKVLSAPLGEGEDGEEAAWNVRHLPHLVLAGVALVDQALGTTEM